MIKVGSTVLFYLPHDAYTSTLSYNTKPDGALFRDTARIGIVEKIAEDGSEYEISYTYLLTTQTAHVDAEYVREARMRSWNSYFKSYVNPFQYEPSVVLVVAMGGYLIIKSVI